MRALRTVFIVAALVVAAAPRSSRADFFACCLADGTCENLSGDDCCNRGGTQVDGNTCEHTFCREPECRVTGGGVDTFGVLDGTMATGNGQRDRYEFGGQAGAPTASQPQPYGEWTHHQQRGPDGSFVFHAGTASAPDETEIDVVTCADPGFCNPARPAPAHQINFAGVGSFKNAKNVPPLIGNNIVVGESLHWFSVHIEDAGEPGRAGKIDPPAEDCSPTGSAGAFVDCGCPDFYHIRIHAGLTDATPVIYEVFGYITGGNLQIHPAIGS